MIYSSVVVDLVQPNNMTKVNAVKGDTGRGLYIYLKADGQQITGSQVSSPVLYVKRPDEAIYSSNGTFVANQNYFRVDLTEDMLGIDGECKAVVGAGTGSSIITSPEFTIVVHDNCTVIDLDPEVVDSEDPLLGN